MEKNLSKFIASLQNLIKSLLLMSLHFTFYYVFISLLFYHLDSFDDYFVLLSDIHGYPEKIFCTHKRNCCLPLFFSRALNYATRLRS